MGSPEFNPVSKNKTAIRIIIPENELDELRIRKDKQTAIPGRGRQILVEIGLYMRDNVEMFPSYDPEYFSEQDARPLRIYYMDITENELELIKKTGLADEFPPKAG